MSALEGGADIGLTNWNVAFDPKRTCTNIGYEGELRYWPISTAAADAFDAEGTKRTQRIGLTMSYLIASLAFPRYRYLVHVIHRDFLWRVYCS